MSTGNIIINPFLKKDDVLLLAGNKQSITSRFCLQMCSELLNEEKSTFLDSYNQFWFNKPRNIMYINSSSLRFNLEKEFEEISSKLSKNTANKLSKHMYYIDEIAVKNKNLEQVFMYIDDNIRNNKIDLIVFDKFYYFNKYDVNKVEEITGMISKVVKRNEIPLVIVDHSAQLNSIENYAYNMNPLSIYATEILYLSNTLNDTTIYHIKSSTENFAKNSLIRFDGKIFYEVFLNIDKSDYDILRESMMEHGNKFDRKGDLVEVIKYKLRSYDKYASTKYATEIVDDAISSGMLVSIKGTSNNKLIVMNNSNT